MGKQVNLWRGMNSSLEFGLYFNVQLLKSFQTGKCYEQNCVLGKLIKQDRGCLGSGKTLRSRETSYAIVRSLGVMGFKLGQWQGEPIWQNEWNSNLQVLATDEAQGTYKSFQDFEPERLLRWCHYHLNIKQRKRNKYERKKCKFRSSMTPSWQCPADNWKQTEYRFESHLGSEFMI